MKRISRTVVLCFFCSLFSLLHIEAASAASRTISLDVNTGKVIKVYRQAKTVFVANPEIANYHFRAPGMLYIYAKAIGDTSIYVVDANGRRLGSYQIHVTPNLTALRNNLRRLFPQDKISVYAVNNSIAVKGVVPSGKRANEIIQVAGRYVEDSEKQIINMIKVGSPTEVKLLVRVVEMNRSITREIGLNWNATYGPQSARFGIASTFPSKAITDRNFFLSAAVSRGNFDLTAMIDLLDQQGIITVLSQPNLTAKSGETAKFLAGGEFPIIVPQGGALSLSNTVEFKDFGVQLAFTPILLSNKLINLHVRPEVSRLSEQGAVEIGGTRIPALVTRRAETTVELKDGQSFAIAGLLENNSAHLISKFPGLGELPILGRLFTSEEFQRDESELVIIVTPYIVTPTNGDNYAYPTDEAHIAQTTFRKLKYGGHLGFILE